MSNHSNILTADHFLSAYTTLGGLFAQQPTTDGCMLAYTAIMTIAPQLTADAFDWAICRATATCRFMPRPVDILGFIFERSTDSLPPLPDIDLRFADAYSQGVYYRALAARQKALETAPIDPARLTDACSRALGPCAAALLPQAAPRAAAALPAEPSWI